MLYILIRVLIQNLSLCVGMQFFWVFENFGVFFLEIRFDLGSIRVKLKTQNAVEQDPFGYYVGFTLVWICLLSDWICSDF